MTIGENRLESCRCMRRWRSIILLTLLVVIASAAQKPALAQPAPGAVAAAEALFQEGRALLMAGKVPEACPKLEESQRLDPATGTLLALALCHEQQGKLASAWAAFADIEARSRLDGRADRERTAREHGAALRPRLSTLTLAVPADARESEALVISLDGFPIGRPAWNAALPVDGGAHLVEAAIPGRAPWRTSVSISSEQHHARLLVLVPKATPATSPALSGAAAVGAPLPAHRVGARRVVGLVAAGAGAIGLGASVLLGLDARSDYRGAIAQCQGDLCPAEPYRRVQDARDQGDLGTVLAVVSGAAAAAGALLFFWPAARGDARATTSRAQLAVGPGGLAITGKF
jgi:hypothetical protein